LPPSPLDLENRDEMAATALRLPTAARLPGIAVAVAAAVLSTAAVALVGVQDRAGVVAAGAVLAMTVPVIFARRAPLAAALTLLVASPLNGLLFGHMVRCGAALPAAFIVAYFAGSNLAGRERLIAQASVAVSIAAQCVYDPHLGAGIIMLMVPVGAAFGLAGGYVRTRRAMVAELRSQARELRDQRAETARVAVAADRSRIGTDIAAVLRDRLRDIDALAHAEQTDFGAIERAGREILDSMREVVGTLRDPPTAPEAGLDELPDLLARDTLAEARVSVSGTRRPLPTTVELTAYRAVEHLLTAFRDDASTRIDVRVRYGEERLELDVAGPPAGIDPVPIGLVVLARVALYGGTVDISDTTGGRSATVRIPLVAGHV
jgi:signal transduction histidine kinase